MSHAIVLTAGGVSLPARLEANPTGEAIWKALPLEARASRWGDEIYFEIPVSLEEAPDARQDMEVGELAYWPVGSAFCIFFGRTPASTGPRPRAYSNVNPCGKVDGDAGLFRSVRDGERLRVERAGS